MSVNSVREEGPPQDIQASLQDDIPSRIIQPKRKIVVEPVLIMCALFGFPMMLLSQLFIVDHFKRDLAAKYGINESASENQSDSNQCNVNTSDPMYQFQEEVQQKAAVFDVITSVVRGCPALVTTLFLGAYSDKAGRKFAIMPPLTGTIITCVSYLLVINFSGSIYWLLVGAFLEGLTGSYTAILLGAFAYIADTTTPEQRLFRITVAELCMFFSGILGPIGVGIFIERMGFVWPFVAVLAGFSICLLYVIFLIPETVRRDPNARFFSVKHIGGVIRLFSKDNGTNRRWKLTVLFLAFSVSIIVSLETGTSTLFEMNQPLCWDSVMIGYYSAAFIGVSAIGGAVLAKLCKCCLQDHHIALLAGLVAMARMVYTGLVQNTIMMFFVPVLAAMSMLFFPTLRTLMSKLATDSEQGAVFGAIAWAEVLCSMFGTVVFNSIYYATVFFMTGFVFFTMAILYFMACLLLLYYVIRLHRETTLARKYRLLEPEDSHAGESADDEPTFKRTN